MPGWTQLAKSMKVSETVLVGWIIFSILTTIISAWVMAHFFTRL